MEKKIYFAVLAIIAITMTSTLFVSAGFWSNLFGNKVSGQAISTTTVSEMVKCVFNNADPNSNITQSCYSNTGVSCKGTTSCTATVKGTYGTKLTWKSSCGGYAYTTMDGQNDYAQFECGKNVSEMVKCVFSDTNTSQECYSDKGSCKGIGTCTITVNGNYGEQVTWKSSCGGYAYTTMDGQNDYAEFKCGNQKVNELVKCVFYNTNTSQECYSDTGYSCKGIQSCVVNVTDDLGTQLTWKSSCGGYAYTTMDGQNDYAEFKCAVSVPSTYFSAYWTCIEGYQVKAMNKIALSETTWKQYATDDCNIHCTKSCGVSSFGVIK